ncbi:hypothetical protein ANN_24693 [Periplaneta americana]|uniref:Uncharacterized protein n=1 Tax=Periplaneta americana TaxID=6978 RepID=A0ABQ8RZ99_PERAM|nr:hypothetical protein ANN_24693 [Periplaneta americana]
MGFEPATRFPQPDALTVTPQFSSDNPMSPQDVARAVALDNGCSLGYAAATTDTPYTTVQEAVKRFWKKQSYSRRPGSGRKRLQPEMADFSSARF